MESKNSDFSRPICVFDSGIGGLNLLSACADSLPQNDFIYVADNFNVPYGNLPREKILELTDSAFKSINGFQPVAAVVACNTVTAECIGYLRKTYAFPIVGIQPAVKPAAKCGGRCLVLATQATVKSKSFCELVEKYAGKDCVVYPCPHLAEFIEDNIFNLPATLPNALLPDIEADSVVLGCTHYIFVKTAIQERYKCPVFDGIAGTADHLRKILGKTDHVAFEKQKITFINGDIDKNKRVFNQIRAKSNKE